MNTRTAAPVLITVSLVVLMSGCAGAAAQGGQVHDFLSPEGNAAAVGLARGHVIVDDELANLVAQRVEAAIERAAQPQSQRSMSAEARREFHATAPQQAVGVTPWSAEARREFHATAPQQAVGATAWSADARREFHATAPQQALGATTWSADARREFHATAPEAVTSRTLSPEAIRELKAGAPVGVSAAEMQGARLSAYAEAQAAARELNAGAPVEVVDTLSPIHGWTPPTESPAEPVDDYLSPLGGSR